MEKHRWCTRFYRADGQPTESYYFWNENEAREHFEMFREFENDDGMYNHIELLEYPAADITAGILRGCITFPHAS